MKKIISVNQVSKVFNKNIAVNNISFDIEEGEIFGLIGPNGAGKTTTLSMITTLLTPTTGNIHVEGYDTIKEGNEVRKIIGVAFQESLFDNDLTVYDNLDIQAMLYSFNKTERKNAVEKAIKITNLEDHKIKKIEELSGGLKKRVEIARGLLNDPKILFLDEPTLGLDPIAKTKLWEYLKILNKGKEITILINTNNMEEAEHLCQKIAIINEGQIVFCGPINDVKKKAKTKNLEQAFIKLLQ